jgi:hypothetical protein
VPPYISDIYYVVVFTNEGASNVFWDFKTIN